MNRIAFESPAKRAMASGDWCIELTEKGTWESFEPFAEVLAEQWHAKIIEKIDGPDIRIWKIEIEGVVVRLVYDDFPNGVSLEACGPEGNETIEKMFAKVTSKSGENVV